MTTLGEMRRKEPTCPVCGQGFPPGQPVAWTVGRDRIHESCIDRARVSAPGRAKFGPWKAPAVRSFLQRSGGRLCAACLAMALSVSLDQAREIMHIVRGVAGLRVLPVMCASCGRATDALCVVPGATQDRVAS
jgi:hypothetical protein